MGVRRGVAVDLDENRLQQTEEEITEDDWLELQYSNHILFKAEKDGRQTSESGKF